MNLSSRWEYGAVSENSAGDVGPRSPPAKRGFLANDVSSGGLFLASLFTQAVTPSGQAQQRLLGEAGV